MGALPAPEYSHNPTPRRNKMAAITPSQRKRVCTHCSSVLVTLIWSILHLLKTPARQGDIQQKQTGNRRIPIVQLWRYAAYRHAMLQPRAHNHTHRQRTQRPLVLLSISTEHEFASELTSLTPEPSWPSADRAPTVCLLVCVKRHARCKLEPLRVPQTTHRYVPSTHREAVW